MGWISGGGSFARNRGIAPSFCISSSVLAHFYEGHLHIGDFVHHSEGRAIVLKPVFCISSSVLAHFYEGRLHIGDFVHHSEGRAIVLEPVFKGVPMQVANVYMSSKGTAKEYRPLLHWLRAQLLQTHD